MPNLKGHEAVPDGGRAAALNVAEDSEASVHVEVSWIHLVR